MQDAMTQNPVLLPDYSKWIQHVFDHPVHDPEWYWDDEYWEHGLQPWNEFEGTVEALGFMTQLFSRPQFLMELYSTDQIGQGLWYLTCCAASDYLEPLSLASTSEAIKCEWLDSVLILHEQLFSKICSHYYGHLNNGPEPDNEANGACYMFWDNAEDFLLDDLEAPPLVTDKVCLKAVSIMDATLQIRSAACQESALHGLGHWHRWNSAIVEEKIDRFLASDLPVSNEIRNYARKARTGKIQ